MFSCKIKVLHLLKLHKGSRSIKRKFCLLQHLIMICLYRYLSCKGITYYNITHIKKHRQFLCSKTERLSMISESKIARFYELKRKKTQKSRFLFHMLSILFPNKKRFGYKQTFLYIIQLLSPLCENFKLHTFKKFYNPYLPSLVSKIIHDI